MICFTAKTQSEWPQKDKVNSHKNTKWFGFVILYQYLWIGGYALIECKLGSREIEEGAQHLLEIRRLIQEKNKTETQVPLREPDLMVIITGGKIAYARADGVKVIPLACLRN